MWEYMPIHAILALVQVLPWVEYYHLGKDNNDNDSLPQCYTELKFCALNYLICVTLKLQFSNQWIWLRIVSNHSFFNYFNIVIKTLKQYKIECGSYLILLPNWLLSSFAMGVWSIVNERCLARHVPYKVESQSISIGVH